MPIIASAKKKVRKDIKRTVSNIKTKKSYKLAVKKALEKPTAELLSQAFRAVDHAAKKGIMHKNKASRLKSRMARNSKTKDTAGTKKTVAKKTNAKKTVAKKKATTKKK